MKNLPTTQKAVANDILRSGISNGVDGCCYIFMDNRYAAPQLLVMMVATWNIRGIGTYRANQKEFGSDKLPMNNDAERGSYVWLVDKTLGMLITRWKYSRILQTVSTIMKLEKYHWKTS